MEFNSVLHRMFARARQRKLPAVHGIRPHTTSAAATAGEQVNQSSATGSLVWARGPVKFRAGPGYSKGFLARTALPSNNRIDPVTRRSRKYVPANAPLPQPSATKATLTQTNRTPFTTIFNFLPLISNHF